MRLKEFEGKDILREARISVPRGVVISSPDDMLPVYLAGIPLVVKSQVLSGGRGKAALIRNVENSTCVASIARDLLLSSHNGESINELLVEEWISHEREVYVSIGFSTTTRSPVLVLSADGGVDIEAVKKTRPDRVTIVPIDILQGLTAEMASHACSKAGLDPAIAEILLKLYHAFELYHAKLVEVNPLVLTAGGYIALDAKVLLDDDALKRIPCQFPSRTGQRRATAREIAAREIDRDDHRGVAGKSFLDLDGDIAVLASGGGASLAAMDALLSYGGRPANYVEYSGNPPEEKVRRLALITLDKPNLIGCWIVGGTANFTRIDETMRGIIAALEVVNPQYPVIVRRAGPGDVEAFRMLREAADAHGWHIETYGESVPVTESAKIMVERANAYRASCDKS